MEVFDTWDRNSDNIIEKIKGMINTWSRRKFEFDRKGNYHKVINVVNICLFILSFTKPARCLTQIFRGNVFFKFLWNKGPDRISRKQIVRNIEAGGLRMTEIKAFIASLKVTWLRRLIMNWNNDDWRTISNINLSKLFSLGGHRELIICPIDSNGDSLVFDSLFCISEYMKGITLYLKLQQKYG